MASNISKGESLLVPFRNGRSITDSQGKPRMYKTYQAFEKAFPKHYLGTDGVELVEYAPVVHGRWISTGIFSKKAGYGVQYYRHEECEVAPCRLFECRHDYCPNCGAKMDGG